MIGCACGAGKTRKACFYTHYTGFYPCICYGTVKREEILPLKHPAAAPGTDAEGLAGAGAKDGIHLGGEFGGEIGGDKGLDGAGKAAAVDTVGPAAPQEMFGQGQGHAEPLLLRVLGGIDILVIQERGAARLNDQLLEGGEVPGLQHVGG